MTDKPYGFEHLIETVFIDGKLVVKDGITQEKVKRMAASMPKQQPSHLERN